MNIQLTTVGCTQDLHAAAIDRELQISFKNPVTKDRAHEIAGGLKQHMRRAWRITSSSHNKSDMLEAFASDNRNRYWDVLGDFTIAVERLFPAILKETGVAVTDLAEPPLVSFAGLRITPLPDASCVFAKKYPAKKII